MLLELVALGAGLGVAWLVWKAFFAPIYPPGFSAYEQLPSWRLSRFGRFIGDGPFDPIDQNHRHFLDLGKTYGPLVRKRVVARNVLAVTDLQDGIAVLKDRKSFPTRAYTGINYYLPHGLLGLETGDQWRAHRRAITPMFADRYMKIYAESFVRIANLLIHELDALPETQSVDIHDALSKMSLDIIGVCGFGTDFNAVRSPNSNYMDASFDVLKACIMRTMIPPMLYSLVFPQEAKKADFGINLFAAAIRKTVTEMGGDSTHMLAQLHAAGFTDDELIQELVTMVMAGHETSANAMTWCLYLLSQHEAAAEKVREELDVLYSRDDFHEEKLFNHRTDLPFLRACLLETLRLYPTVPLIPRVSGEGARIRDVDVPPGVTVMVPVFAIFRNPRNFADPDAFKPERFASAADIDSADALFFPFGAGDRVCIGRRFAMLELTIVVAMMMHRYKFVLDPKQPEIVDQAHITLTPKNGMKMFLIPRHRA